MLDQSSPEGGCRGQAGIVEVVAGVVHHAVGQAGCGIVLSDLAVAYQQVAAGALLQHVGKIFAAHKRFDLAYDFFVARSEEHTSELQSLMRISYAVFCLKKKTND